MKKILFGILTFLGIGLSFCSAGSITLPGQSFTSTDNWGYSFIAIYSVPSFGYTSSSMISASCSFENLSVSGPGEYEIHIFGLNGDGNFTDFGTSPVADYLGLRSMIACGILTKTSGTYSISFDSITFTSDSIVELGGSCEDKSISVFYNSGNTESILCDGVQAIQINGLSTITSTNTFTPYYNISYTDEDNQKLTESYSKDILYLENGQFKKTYTGNNDWILTVQGNSDNSFSGYLPTFEITGGIEDVSESGNIFNNFAENSVKFTLSNIPSYIQYVILLFILFFILGFIRKFRRK